MIHDFQPYSFVEDRGFSELMQQLEPHYQIPHRTTFSRSIVPSMYKEARKEVESKLSDVLQSKNKMALTTDMWTSEANDAYLGLTCHFLTADFELVSLCLAVEPFTGRHTGVNIASCLKQILRDFTIDQAAVSAVITDNASNMDLASRLGEWNSRHCFGHTLQLAIDDGIKISPGMREMIKSTKAIVAFYNRSTKGPRVSLSTAEWCMMSELIQILQPLEEATRELSAEQRVCCSNIIPLPNALLFELRKNVVDDDETQVPDDDETQVPESQGSSVPTSEESQQVVVGLIASIEWRWLNYEEDRIYSICTLLDPRFKEVCFTSAALVRAKRLLLSIMRALTQGDSVISSASVVNDDQEDVPIKKMKCLWNSFDELKKKKSTDLSTNQDKDEKELSLYCSAEYIDRKEDPLAWWKGNKSRFPTLARIAREYLAILAMSTPSERLFSAAGYISSQRRSRLSGENLNQLVFLNKNL
ncbi:zinc finger BED domain-containing protein 4-like [Dysidea avara]|uniref:zinc finger BED domain-containing protein 4-like n=1 Tax=Dysidea avara TaxID=196820 RepID=UPI0033286620